jgi:hypothetical protein
MLRFVPTYQIAPLVIALDQSVENSCRLYVVSINLLEIGNFIAMLEHVLKHLIGPGRRFADSTSPRQFYASFLFTLGV